MSPELVNDMPSLEYQNVSWPAYSSSFLTYGKSVGVRLSREVESLEAKMGMQTGLSETKRVLLCSVW